MGLSWTCKNGNDINGLKKITIALQNDINDLISKVVTPEAANSQTELRDVENIVQSKNSLSHRT